MNIGAQDGFAGGGPENTWTFNATFLETDPLPFLGGELAQTRVSRFFLRNLGALFLAKLSKKFGLFSR